MQAKIWKSICIMILYNACFYRYFNARIKNENTHVDWFDISIEFDKGLENYWDFGQQNMISQHVPKTFFYFYFHMTHALLNRTVTRKLDEINYIFISLFLFVAFSYLVGVCCNHDAITCRWYHLAKYVMLLYMANISLVFFNKYIRVHHISIRKHFYGD